MKEQLRQAIEASEDTRRVHEELRAAVVARVNGPRPTVYSAEESAAGIRFDYCATEERRLWGAVGVALTMNDSALAALKAWAGLE